MLLAPRLMWAKKQPFFEEDWNNGFDDHQPEHVDNDQHGVPINDLLPTAILSTIKASKEILLQFAFDMTSYFKGQLAKGRVHKAERQLGSKPHFLWTYLEAELEDRVKAAIVSDEFSVMQIFNRQLRTFSTRLAQSE